MAQINVYFYSLQSIPDCSNELCLNLSLSSFITYPKPEKQLKRKGVKIASLDPCTNVFIPSPTEVKQCTAPFLSLVSLSLCLVGEMHDYMQHSTYCRTVKHLFVKKTKTKRG